MAPPNHPDPVIAGILANIQFSNAAIQGIQSLLQGHPKTRGGNGGGGNGVGRNKKKVGGGGTPPTPVFANADTGTTGNFISLDDTHIILDVKVTKNPVTVILPDGSTAVSTHTGLLNIPSLPMAARGVDIFPQWVGSLLSIGRLCDHGLSALYTSSTVTISDGDGAVILSGHRCPRTSLWLIDISGASPSLMSTHKTAESLTANAVITEAKGTQEQVVAYYHACMGAPAPTTFTKAIDKLGLALPGLTSDMVRRFPPITTATPKGHMGQFP